MRLSVAFACASALILFSGVATAAPDADLAAARQLAREGKSDAALAAAKALVATAPDDAAPGRLVQDVLRAEGRVEDLGAWVPEGASPLVSSLLQARVLAPAQAETALKSLVGKAGAPPQTHVDLASVYLALGKVRLAENEAKAYIELRPDDAEGHLALGRARLASGNAAAAHDPAEKAMTLAPGWAPAVALFAEVVTATGSAAEANLAFTDALQQYPENPELMQALATHQEAVDELEQAEATLGKLIKLRGTNASYRVQLAQVQRSLGKSGPAEEAARTAIELDAKNAAAYRVLGLLLEQKDDLEGALAAFDESAQLRPDWPQAWVDQGVVLTLMDDLEGAREVLEHAIKLDKKHVEAQYRLARVHYFGEDSKAAKKCVDVVLREDRDHVGGNRLMGRLLLADGKAKSAIKHFQKAAEADLTDSDSMRMIGKCWVQLGKPEQALTALENALDRDPDDAWAYLDFGKALEATERFEDAEEYYRKAVELKPDQPWFRLYLARLLDDFLDEPEQALEHYKAYIEHGGDDTDGDIAGRIEQLET